MIFLNTQDCQNIMRFMMRRRTDTRTEHIKQENLSKTPDREKHVIAPPVRIGILHITEQAEWLLSALSKFSVGKKSDSEAGERRSA